MRLIDADELINKQYRIDDSATLSTRDVVNIEDIEDAQTIQAIPIDVLDKIRAEITKVIDENKVINSNNSRAQNIGLMWVLELIDKCTKEQ